MKKMRYVLVHLQSFLDFFFLLRGEVEVDTVFQMEAAQWKNLWVYFSELWITYKTFHQFSGITAELRIG